MANFFAFSQFNINTVDFNAFYRTFTQSQLNKDVDIPLNGVTYPDEFFIQSGTLSLEFLGAGITAGEGGAITGGSVGALGVADLNTKNLLWLAQGFTVSATSLYDAAKSLSTADELAIVQTVFAGNDKMILSSASDTMNGFAGNDQIEGLGGNDILDGGDGTDTAVYLDEIETATFGFDGNVLIVTTPTGGTDRLTNFEQVNFNGNVRLISSLTDLVKPVVTSFAPADGAVGVALASNVTLTFSEVIRKGTGAIALHLGSATGPVVETFDAATSARLTVAGSTLTVDPTNNFLPGTKYFVTFDKGVVTDVLGNKYDGSTTYDLTSFGADFKQQYRLFAPSNYSASIDRGGQVFGTPGLQDITILPSSLTGGGAIVFDPSFNRGGDIIRLSGNASTWQIARSGSSATLSDGQTAVTVPLGTEGVDIVFTDGTRILKFDATNNITIIGNQTFSDQPATISASPDNPILPIGIDPAAFGRIFVADGGSVFVNGKADVFGSSGANEVVLLAGEVRLDPSFNRGGDDLVLRANAEQFTAVLKGSSVFFDGPGLDATVPVGEAGMAILFNGSDNRVLAFDAATNTVHLGSQLITSTPVIVPAFG